MNIPTVTDFRAYADWAYKLTAFTESPKKSFRGVPAQPKTGVPFYLGAVTFHQFSENMTFAEQAMLCEFLAYSHAE